MLRRPYIPPARLLPRPRWLVAIGLVVLLGCQSLGSRALLLCLCELTPEVASAQSQHERDCCGAERTPADGTPTEAPGEPADDCDDCVFVALGVEDALVQIAPIPAAAVMPPRWTELLVPSLRASSTRLAVLPRPPPLPDPILRHLSTVHLTI